MELEENEASYEVTGPKGKRQRLESPVQAKTQQVSMMPAKQAKIKPLVLDGLKSGEIDNPLELRKLLIEANADIAKTVKKGEDPCLPKVR